jgi:hypothetical protein
MKIKIKLKMIYLKIKKNNRILIVLVNLQDKIDFLLLKKHLNTISVLLILLYWQQVKKIILLLKFMICLQSDLTNIKIK